MPADTQSVSVILPAFNEERAVAQEVEKIQRVLRSHGVAHELIVVDDGSHDRTGERAREAGARVLQHLENRGYGTAIKTGIAAARYDTIVISDADGTYPADEIPALLDKLETADMVVGARTGKDVHIPLARRPAKWILNWVATRVAGRAIPDLNSGLRAFRREVVRQYFSILSNRFSFTSTVTLALVADDYRVVYHPINYYPRIGTSKITPWHFMDFMMLVLRMAVLFQPLKVFLPVAVTCVALGLLKTIYDVVTFFPRTSTTGWSFLYLPVLSTSAILFLLVGFQLLLVGLVADGVLRRIAQQHKPLLQTRAIRLHETSDARESREDVAAARR